MNYSTNTIRQLVYTILNEDSNSSLRNEVVSYLNKQMLNDKKEYRGNIPNKYNKKGMEWSDSSWIITEIMQFIKKDFTTSYTLIEFGEQNNYNNLDGVLKTEFATEYQKAEDLINQF